MKLSLNNDYAQLVKKMRLLKKLNRQEAAKLFNFSDKYIEKLENNRARITCERFKEFKNKYGISDHEIEALRSGKLEAPTNANCIRGKKYLNKNRPDRRFCKRQITRECKVLKELRLIKNLEQYEASSLCGFGKNTIGFIENGRVTLTDKKIRHIVSSYGHSMELYYQLMKVPQLRHELIEQGQQLLEKMDENKLRMVMPVLINMA